MGLEFGWWCLFLTSLGWHAEIFPMLSWRLHLPWGPDVLRDHWLPLLPGAEFFTVTQLCGHVSYLWSCIISKWLAVGQPCNFSYHFIYIFSWSRLQYYKWQLLVISPHSHFPLCMSYFFSRMICFEAVCIQLLLTIKAPLFFPLKFVVIL